MASETISQAVAKVVFEKHRTFNNGKNYIWIRISRTKTTTLARYWRNKLGFHYMKIYLFNRKTRVVGEQIGFITHRVATNNIDPHLLWKKTNL